jgi:hypothetical protein
MQTTRIIKHKFHEIKYKVCIDSWNALKNLLQVS